tara:strand:+ start:105604 stop:106143 length:540 start_codon:yes stop_codon:yes gene_type:complete
MQYTGQAKTLPAETLRAEPGWSYVPGLRGIRQESEKDCGSAVLASVLQYWNVHTSREALVADIGPKRASMGELRELSHKHGMQAYVVPGTWDDLVHEVAKQRPVVIGVLQPHGRESLTHYEVVVGIHATTNRVATFDPARGLRVRTRKALMSEWGPTKQVALVILPSTRTSALTREARE